MKLFDKLIAIKKNIFWRKECCPACGAWRSSSNRSPCYNCEKGDHYLDNENWCKKMEEKIKEGYTWDMEIW